MLANPVRLGDVDHRSHPAGLGATRVHQRRHIQPCMEQRAVTALDAQLDAARLDLAGQLFLQALRQQLAVGLRPIRERRGVADQVGLAPAGHLAKRRIHIGDAALQIERAHAGQHRILHRAAERGLGHQRLLRTHAPARMTPVCNQHPGRHQAERRDQPKQPAADHAERGSVRLGPDHQAVADRRNGHLVRTDRVFPWHQTRCRAAYWRIDASQHGALGIEQRNRVAGRHLSGNAVAKQAIHRVLGQQDAGKTGAVAERNVQLQRGRVVGCRRPLRVNRLQQVARQAVGAFGFVLLQRAADDSALGVGKTGGADTGLDASALIDPGDALQFRVAVDQRLGPNLKILRVELTSRDFAGDPHELLLTLEQTQPKPLLRVLDIAPDGLLFAINFLQAQIGKSSHNGSQKQQHGGQRRQHGYEVLVLRRHAPPPVSQACPQRRAGYAGLDGQVARRHGVKCRGVLVGSASETLICRVIFHIVIYNRTI